MYHSRSSIGYLVQESKIFYAYKKTPFYQNLCATAGAMFKVIKLVSCNNFSIHKKTSKTIGKEFLNGFFSQYRSLQVTLTYD